MGDQVHEPEILERIKGYSEAHPGRKHVSTLLDSFTITDHYGPHLCLVFEVLGTFISTVYQSGKRIPIPIVKHIARQLLLALDFLHRECGVIHTGKLLRACYRCLYIGLLALRQTSNQTTF